MRAAFALAFAALAAAAPAPQGVSSAITPESTAPAGCSSDYDGTFRIQVVNVTSSKRSLETRQSDDCEGSECQASDDLTMTLQGGVLKDDEGRTGYIAANDQFQFDAPPQAGAIYTAGWSVCSNNSLAIGDDAIFYSCLSGTFYNLYDDNDLAAGQCVPVYIQVVGGGGAVEAPTSSAGPAESQASATSAPATSAPAATSAPSAPATTAPPVSQISDGQVQQPTGTGSAPPASSYTGPAIATGAAAPTGMPKMVGLAGAALAAVAMF